MDTYCKLCNNHRQKIRYQKNRNLILKRRKEYRSTEQYLESHREYRKKRKAEDLNFRLGVNLRVRLYSAIRNKQKVGSAVEDLGCSVKYLIEYLGNMFQEGMSWDNWGEWHIDHITPISSFDLEDREQFLKACHYTNLQPLWARENYSKGNRIKD